MSKRTMILFLVLLSGAGVISYLVAGDRAEKGQAFLDAVERGDLGTVQELLKSHPRLISVQDRWTKAGTRSPVLHFAIRCGHGDIVELLLSGGADPNERDVYGIGALHKAAQKGRADLVETLVEHGANANARTRGHRTPLSFATSREGAEALISHGADVGLRDKGGATPLHSVASRGEADVVEILLANGADINARDARGLTPLERAIESEWASEPRRRTTAGLLISQGAEYTIHDVAWLGDATTLRELLEDNPALANDVSKPHREPLLFSAIRGDQSETVALLLAKGANLNVKGRHEEPPLHAAAYAGHEAVVEVLLEGGADVNQTGGHGELALHWAAAKRHVGVAKVLLEAGSQVNTKTEKQRVGMDTIMREEADVVKQQLRFLELREQQRRAMLAGRGLQIAVSPRLAFAAGDTPLHSAVQWGHRDIVKLLLDGGAEVNAVNRWGQTALHYACVFRQKEVVQMLLDAGADVNVMDKNGHTAVVLASLPKGTANHDIVELLLSKGAARR